MNHSQAASPTGLLHREGLLAAAGCSPRTGCSSSAGWPRWCYLLVIRCTMLLPCRAVRLTQCLLPGAAGADWAALLDWAKMAPSGAQAQAKRSTRTEMTRPPICELLTASMAASASSAVAKRTVPKPLRSSGRGQAAAPTRQATSCGCSGRCLRWPSLGSVDQQQEAGRRLRETVYQQRPDLERPSLSMMTSARSMPFWLAKWSLSICHVHDHGRLCTTTCTRSPTQAQAPQVSCAIGLHHCISRTASLSKRAGAEQQSDSVASSQGQGSGLPADRC